MIPGAYDIPALADGFRAMRPGRKGGAEMSKRVFPPLVFLFSQTNRIGTCFFALGWFDRGVCYKDRFAEKLCPSSCDLGNLVSLVVQLMNGQSGFERLNVERDFLKQSVARNYVS